MRRHTRWKREKHRSADRRKNARYMRAVDQFKRITPPKFDIDRRQMKIMDDGHYDMVDAFRFAFIASSPIKIGVMR